MQAQNVVADDAALEKTSMSCSTKPGTVRRLSRDLC
jgi:hypothetical protein